MPSILLLVLIACSLAAGAARAEVAPGGTASHGADGYWSAMHWPSPRYGHTAVPDPLHDRMIVFGGYDGASFPDGYYYPSIVWMLTLSDPPRWTRYRPPGSQPLYRYTQTAIYDPLRNRMIVFGGSYTHPLDDLWQLSLGDSLVWSPLVASGGPPAARHRHAAVYDPVRDRMIVSGGTNDTTLFADVWALSLSGAPAWSEITPPAGGPGARYRHSAIYDPPRDRVIVFGGRDGSGDFNDTWALDLGDAPSWSEIQAPAPLPRTRGSHCALYDAAGDRMLVYGGEGATRNDVWSLALSGPPAWSPVTPAGAPPAGHSSHSMALDAARNRLVVFGGKSDSSSATDDLSMLALGGAPAWTRVPPPSAPTPQGEHTAIYDPVGARIIPFAGMTYMGGPINEAWSLSLEPDPVWSRITTPDPVPNARYVHVSIYDRLRERMVAFGGYAGVGNAVSGDVWTLSLAGAPVWSSVPSFGEMPASSYTTPRAYYDPVEDRMIYFLSFDSYRYFPTVWALSMSKLGRWVYLSTTGVPPEQSESPSIVYDPPRDRMLVFGGCTSNGMAPNDVWALPLRSRVWTKLSTQGSKPVSRCRFSAVYDPIRDRMLMIGGRGAFGIDTDEVWELSLADPPTWRRLSFFQPAPPTLTWGTAVAIPERDWIVHEGGFYGSSALSDTWILEGGSPAVPACEPAGASWIANDVIELRYAVLHPLESARSLTWTLKSARAWPGLPRQGVVLVAAAAQETIAVRVTVPDTALAGANRLTFGVSFTGADGAEVTTTRDLRVPAATLDVPPSVGPLSLRVGPNPTRSEMTALFSLPAPGRATLELFDVMGRRVSRRDLSLGEGSHAVPVAPGARLSPGLYMVKLSSGGTTLRARAVVVD